MGRENQDKREEPDLRSIEEICASFRGLPDLDSRSPDEILGYDEYGLFGEDGDFSLTDLPLVPY